MQMRMMYGSRNHLDQCEFCPGTVYFITDTQEIWFDAPDRMERIRMTIDPSLLELNQDVTNTRIDSVESTLDNTEQFLQELSSISLPSYGSNRW